MKRKLKIGTHDQALRCARAPPVWSARHPLSDSTAGSVVFPVVSLQNVATSGLFFTGGGVSGTTSFELTIGVLDIYPLHLCGRTGTGSLVWEPEVAHCAGAGARRNESLPVLFRRGREGSTNIFRSDSRCGCTC
jgi:hypothetical protein